MIFLLFKGEITCIRIRLDDASGGEEKAATFARHDLIPDLHFSQGETFKFSLWLKEESEPNIITQITQYRREGGLSFRVFLPGAQRPSYWGSQTFILEPNRSEYSFRWDNIAINQGLKGRIGTLAITLHLERVA